MKRNKVHADKSAHRLFARGTPNAPASAVKPLATAVTLALVAFSQPTLAANCTWNPVTGNWATASDWSCAAVPGGADSATVGAAKTVTIDTGQSILNLTNAGGVNIDAFLLTLNGGGSTTNTGTINVGAGPIPNNAALNIGGGHNIDNTGGTINVRADSVINQFGSTISGGTINTTGTGKLVVYGNTSNFLSGVTLNGTLDLATNGGSERITNNLALNGNAALNGNGILSFEGANTLSGAATITFGNTGSGNRLGIDNSGVLTTNAGTLIHGQNGTIGQAIYVGGGSTLNNGGKVSADVAGGVINNVTTLTNNSGQLAAENGGTLYLSGTVVQSATGTAIAVGSGSTIVQNGVQITGGTVGSSSGGTYTASNSGSNFLNAVKVSGPIDLATSTGSERVTGGMTLVAGSNIALNANSILSFEGNNTLTGSGSVTLGDTGSGNRIGIDNNGTLTVDTNVLVHGKNGTIGQAIYIGGGSTLVNKGTINADVAGGTINIVANTTNQGTLAASNGGTLLLSSNVNGAAGSSISAGAGSSVVQNGVVVSGVINTAGSGTFTAISSGANYFNGVTLNGTLDLASATGSERVLNNLALNGNINLNLNSVLSFEGNNTLSGNAVITLGDTGANNRIGIDNNGTLTTSAGTLIHGKNGTIGQAIYIGGGSTLVNNGTISADVAGGSINIVAATTNGGTLSALNGGQLVLSNNVTGLASGSINAGAGSQVLQNSVTVSGTINTSGSGLFTATSSGSNYFNGVTLNGALDLASGTGSERILNNLALNGNINVNQNSVLNFEGNNTLSGNAVITLGDTGASNRIGIDNNGTLTTNAGTLIHGKNGTIGQAIYIGGGSTLNNGGKIAADVAGGAIDNVATLTNNSAQLAAENGGRLVLSGKVNQTSTGTAIAVGSGSTVFQNGVQITGGTLGGTGGGVFSMSNSGANYLTGVTVAGLVDMAAATASERVTGGMTLAAGSNIAVNSNSILSFEGNNTLTGSGSITLGDTGSSNRIGIDNNGTLTVDTNVLVHGKNGTIGQAIYVGGSSTLVNKGTINADVAGGLITIVADTVTNNGTFSATAGTLTLNRAINGTGTLLTSGTGQINVGGSSTVGSLVNNGTGASALNLGSSNITVSGDYTNANWGSGNSFNRRADVSGTGQILAGGDVSQVITGAGVTNGNTANATLTIGNVRVGANTFNYQIGNAGTTGPTLRGAIQTSVNGGNINDARLSGAGVTASNYNAGGPGGNSGNLAVVFNAASAGALAPLSGQAVNLRSNFENIADQKLNIVLAGGAAAYNAAAGSAGSPVNIANQRVNGTNSAAVGIANTAAPGAYSEDLNASVGSVSGPVVGSGSISGRLAGTNNTGTGGINVGVATGSAGAKTGTVTIDYQTAGAVNGVGNGLGVASAGSQTITVSGNVYQVAAGQLQGNTLNFGTLQVGQQVNQNLVVRNTATGPAGFVEDLNASFGASGNSQISGSGSLNGILAGQNSSGANGTMTVTVTGATAGALNSGIAVNYFSAGTVNGVSNTLGVLGVGSEQFNVNGTIQATGNVINQANPRIDNPTITLAARRVGDAAATANVSVTNVAGAPPQAALNASIATNGAPVTASGSFNLLNPGATNNASLLVGISTATAGNFTGGNAGSATVSLVSDASNVGNCAPNCQMSLAPQTVGVQGKVYSVAQGSVQGAVDFGIVHVGDVASQGVSVQNSAPATALNDTLKATIGGTGGAFSNNGGTVSGLAAGGAANNSALLVGLNTATAGIFSGNAIVSLASQNPDMADLGLGNANVALSAQVNKYANAVFDKVSGAGTLSRNGNVFTLDFGNVLQGSGALSALLDVDNAVGGGPADLLDGMLSIIDGNDFAAQLLLSAFQNIGADGSSGNALSFLFDTNALGLGSFQDSIDLGWFGHNASGYSDATRHYTLLVRGSVYTNGGGTVPEPSAALLVLTALAGLALRRRPRDRAC